MHKRITRETLQAIGLLMIVGFVVAGFMATTQPAANAQLPTPSPNTPETTHFTNLFAQGNVTAAGNMTAGGDLMVLDDTLIGGELGVLGRASITGDLNVTGKVSAGNILFISQAVNDLLVDGNTELTGTLDAKSGVFNSKGTLMLYDDTTVTGTLVSAGGGDFYDSVTVWDDATITGSLDVLTDIYNAGGPLALNDDTIVDGTLDVQDITTLWDTLTVYASGVVTANLDVQGYLWSSVGDLVVRDNMTVTGDLVLSQDLAAYGPATFYDDVLITSTLDVWGATTLADDLTVNADATITGTLDIQDVIENTTGTVWISDDATIQGDAFIQGDAYFYDQVTIAAPTLITSTLDVDGATTLDADLTVNARAAVTGTLDVQTYVWNSTGALVLDDDIVRITNDLDAQGIADFAGAVTINNDVVVTGTLDVQSPVQDSNGPLYLTDDVIITGLVYDSFPGIAGAFTLDDDHTNITGSVFDGSGDLVLGDAVNITSTLDVDSDLNVDGNAVVDGSLTVGGSVYNYMGALKVTEAGAILGAGQNGYMIYFDASAVLSATVTLPAAAAGKSYCFYNFDANDYYIDPAGGDIIYVLTNATGDRILNTTLGDSVCLVAVDADNWLAFARIGTWSDAD